MPSSSLKIFYSWQSDLPGNRTRYLIQEIIQNVVNAMKDVVEIDADRDTKGEFGAPDITQTIFSKIDESDIFIADISIINKYYSTNVDGSKSDEIKASPNPNVLIELGYAAKTLGWENVICIINTEYGDIDELPFDIAHRRLTPFNLVTTTKENVKKELSSIIISSVMNILSVGKRPKIGAACHVLGMYDFKEKVITNNILLIDILRSPQYENQISTMVQKCRKLIDSIDKIKLKPYEKESIEDKKLNQSKETPEENILNPLVAQFPTLSLPKYDLLATQNVAYFIKEKEKCYIKEKTKSFLSVELENDFFYLGQLKKSVSLRPNDGTEYFGTHEEKCKATLIDELQYSLLQIEILQMYANTFKDLLYFPIAIHNISTISDEDITIYITVDNSTADVISPNKTLIDRELEGTEGILYDTGFIKSLLIMPENSDIQYDQDISYCIEDAIARTRNIRFDMFGNGSPHYNAEDYERELQKYISTPIADSINEFEFYIKSLHANEKKWIGSAILLRKKSDKINFKYVIKSHNSDGALNGDLYCNLSK